MVERIETPTREALDEQVATGPKVLFRTTIGGYRAEIGDDRVVELRRGEDDCGRISYALRTINQGHQIDLVLSDAALDAITRMYCDLIVKEMTDAVADEDAG